MPRPRTRRSDPIRTLTHLPDELLCQIALKLDLQTALAFAHVCRRCSSPAKSRIWRDLTVNLPAHYGELPLLEPDPTIVEPNPGDLATMVYVMIQKGLEDRDVHWRCAERIKEAIEEMKARADERKWRLVKHISAAPTKEVLEMLRVVAPCLLSLEILAAPARYHYLLPIANSLDAHLSLSGISFASLTHIRLQPRSSRVPKILLSLCLAAPGLVSLDADLEPDELHDRAFLTPPSEQDKVSISAMPSLGRPTRLRDIRLIIPARHIDMGPVYSLLRASPELRRLSITPREPQRDIGAGEILDAVRGHKDLRDLHLTGGSHEFVEDSTAFPQRCVAVPESEEEEGASFPSLKRLKYQPKRQAWTSNEWSMIFGGWPAIPDVEVLCLANCTTVDLRSAEPPHSFLTPAKSMTSLFGSKLRSSPHLHLLFSSSVPQEEDDHDISTHFDDLADPNQATGFVNSYRNRDSGQELIHAELFLRYYEFDDVPLPEDGALPTARDHLIYEARDGSQRVKLFSYDPQPRWTQWTDFEGMVVPLEVLEEMRVVPGLSEERWRGRGVDVGDEAWAVLLGWVEKQR